MISFYSIIISITHSACFFGISFLKGPLHITQKRVPMGVGHSSLSLSLDPLLLTAPASSAKPKTSSFFITRPQKPVFPIKQNSSFSGFSLKIETLNCGGVAGEMETEKGIDAAQKPIVDLHGIDEGLIPKIVFDALVWSSLRGLVVGDRNVQVYHQSFFFFQFSIYPLRHIG